jgi:hypothetical protein
MKPLAFQTSHARAQRNAYSKGWDDRWDDALPEFTAALLGLSTPPEAAGPTLIWSNDAAAQPCQSGTKATANLRLL